MEHSPIPPYHGEVDPTKRSNVPLKTLISMYVKNDHQDWNLHIHEFHHVVNTALQSSTKVSPTFLNLGKHARPVKSLRREVEAKGLIKRVSAEVWLGRFKRLDVLWDMIAKNIDKVGEMYYNRGRRYITHNVGDQIM